MWPYFTVPLEGHMTGLTVPYDHDNDQDTPALYRV